MNKLRTIALTGICFMNLLAGTAFANELAENPFLRERAKEIGNIEPQEPQIDDGRSNPFASPVLTVICGTKSSPRSQLKFKIGDLNVNHSLKTQSGTQVKLRVLDINSKVILLSASMTNAKLGQKFSVSPVIVAANAAEVGSPGQASFFSTVELNGEMCALFYAK